MNESKATELEKRLGFELPVDYWKFLVNNIEGFLENELYFREPRNGVVDELLTADRIVDNNEKDTIGITGKSLLHIGGNIMRGYLYLNVSEDKFGEVVHMENYEFREKFPSFSSFLEETVERKA
jgi:hypothetical protein